MDCRVEDVGKRCKGLEEWISLRSSSSTSRHQRLCMGGARCDLLVKFTDSELTLKIVCAVTFPDTCGIANALNVSAPCHAAPPRAVEHMDGFKAADICVLSQTALQTALQMAPCALRRAREPVASQEYGKRR